MQPSHPLSSPSPPDFSSIQFSCLVVSDSLRPHGLQHARPPCPSPIPGVYSNSCPLSWSCHPTISSFVPFSCLPSFPASVRKVKVKITQLNPTLCDPMDCIQARILEWVAFLFSRGSSQPRNRTQVSRIAGGFFTS